MSIDKFLESDILVLPGYQIRNTNEFIENSVITSTVSIGSKRTLEESKINVEIITVIKRRQFPTKCPANKNCKSLNINTNTYQTSKKSDMLDHMLRCCPKKLPIQELPKICPSGDQCITKTKRKASIYENKDTGKIQRHMEYCCPELIQNYDLMEFAKPRWKCSKCNTKFTLKNSGQGHIETKHLNNNTVRLIRIEPSTI